MYFGPLNSKDNELIRLWRNNPTIYQRCRQVDFINDLQQEAWFKRQSEDPTIQMYAVRATGTDGREGIVGVAGLTDIKRDKDGNVIVDSGVEFSLYIGPEYHGYGLGRAALVGLLDRAFSHYPFGMVYGEVFTNNPAFALYCDVGFIPGDMSTRSYYKQSKYVDAQYVHMTRERWKLVREKSLESSQLALGAGSSVA